MAPRLLVKSNRKESDGRWTMKAVIARNLIQIQNIILATDFSPAAATALPFAAELAKHFAAKLLAVHAKTPENYALPTTEMWPVANMHLEEETSELRGTLRNQFPDVESEVLVAEGGVWGVVEKLAKEENADLIVVGTNGRRGIDKFILGSVTEEILRQATCPVLTVGPHCSVHRIREGGIRRILFATDFGQGSPTAAVYAVGLAQEYQARLTLVHVIGHPRAGDLVRPHDLEEAAMEHLRGFVADEAELWCEPRAVVVHGVPAERILEMAENEQSDLIVLGVRNTRGILRATHLPMAVAHQVISRAMCPVLTVRV
jgi:nucleotide-binding universal stress UspA family protein